MHCPSWLLNIMVSYLSERSLRVNYQGAKSLPGGGPQGSSLGGVVKVKYTDDGTVGASIDLKKSLILDPISRQRPLAYDEKNMLILYYLNEMQSFTENNMIKINQTKTKIMLFNLTRKNTNIINLINFISYCLLLLHRFFNFLFLLIESKSKIYIVLNLFRE